MPRLNLIPTWTVLSSRDAIFREMDKTSFDPRQKVILEKNPDIIPSISETKGTVKVMESTANSLLIRANTPSDSILLVTDNYSKGWQAIAQKGSIQKDYEIIPANYTFMAIPLRTGEHYLRLEYRPDAFVIGKWISLVSLSIYIIIIAILLWKSKVITSFFRK